MKKAVMPGHIKKQMAACGKYNEGYYIALYDGAVQYIDAEMGKIIDEFYKLGLQKNTVLIFTADHGEDLGERNYFFDHGPLVFNAASRVPLLVFIPGEKARRIKTPVSVMDIYPTILELLKIDFPSYRLQGVDLLAPREDRVFFLIGWVGTYGIVKNNLHYIDVNPKTSKRFNLEPGHFYDIFDDPYEQKNLYNKYKNEARKMSAEYMAYYNKHGYFKRDQLSSKEKLLTKREMKRLKALGYL
jgi:arylsulfatase A-like enzyme